MPRRAIATDQAPAAIGTYSQAVEVDGTVLSGIAVVSGTNLLLLDVSGLASGPHTFKARLRDASGWWGAWNAVPFDASKPGQVGLRIVGE